MSYPMGSSQSILRISDLFFPLATNVEIIVTVRLFFLCSVWTSLVMIRINVGLFLLTTIRVASPSK